MFRTLFNMSILLFLGTMITFLTGQEKNGTLVGVILDQNSKEPLVAANIVLTGTAIGASTDIDGTFLITQVPAGNYTIEVIYIGYKSKTISAIVKPGESTKLRIFLELQVVEGQEVTVTALLEGQAQAINQQLNSNTIVNVVSSDKIQELPDQNAAESVGRLPGISVQRDAGEGTKVVVRGLSPKFNAITVNGERIPGTDGEDRSVDLSMISPDVLAGIEVFKSLTPDKDADAVGGTVNFVVKKAPEGFRSNLRMQTGYNDQQKEFGQYRGSFSVSNRFVSGKLGMITTGSIQRADRSSDLLNADYVLKDPGQALSKVLVAKLNLADRLETRDRFSGSLAMDYKLGDGGLFLSSFWGKTNRDEVRRRIRYRVDDGRTEYDLRDSQINTQVWTSSLRGDHNLGWFEIDWQTSLSSSKRKVPFQHFARFREDAAFKNDLIEDQGPGLIPMGAKHLVGNTWFQFGRLTTEDVLDRDITAKLDFKLPFKLATNARGFLKFGGKIRDKSRDRDIEENETPFAEVDLLAQQNPGLWTTDREGRVLVENFVNPSFRAENFLDGQFNFFLGLDRDKLNNFYRTYQDNYRLNRFSLLDNYNAGETISAGYLMTRLNIGQKLMFLPGLRYERTTNDYRANTGRLREDLGRKGAIIDTIGGQQYEDWLPMVHLRYKMTGHFDIRLAVTRTLSRPDYFNLVPFESIGFSEQIIERGNSELNHTTVWNYDAYLSFYNWLGLFTVGGFYKKLENIDYISVKRIVEGQFRGFQITEPVTGNESTVYGFETEVQTNLRFLPSPFDGIVINANYALIESETFFPFFEIGPRSTEPPFSPTIIDTVRKGRLPGQSNNILNLTLGYEKGGFTGRLSMVYQDESLLTVGSRRELDGFTDAYVRWDASLQQRLTPKLSVNFNINNISNRQDRAFLGFRQFPIEEEFFGWTADFGIRYKF